ncbi:MAG: 50S ribosomal protein L10 [Bacteroidetes bacterium]|nr:50S ribosomal protein L10 [Bacteroidota bacterium]
MAKTKSQKQATVQNLTKIAKDAKSMVFVHFDKFEVADETSLRRALRGAGNSYQVIKKSLLKKAFEGTSVEGTLPELPGMMAIAYGEDLISPAREVYAFQKDHKDNVEIVGGVFEGKFMNKEEMMSIATIPPMDVLQGMFANIINSPLQRFAIVLSEVAKIK